MRKPKKQTESLKFSHCILVTLSYVSLLCICNKRWYAAQFYTLISCFRMPHSPQSQQPNNQNKCGKQTISSKTSWSTSRKIESAAARKAHVDYSQRIEFVYAESQLNRVCFNFVGILYTLVYALDESANVGLLASSHYLVILLRSHVFEITLTYSKSIKRRNIRHDCIFWLHSQT